MYSLKVKTRAGDWFIHHNSDWSGDVILTRAAERNIKIPGQLFLDAARAMFETNLIQLAESGKLWELFNNV